MNVLLTISYKDWKEISAGKKTVDFRKSAPFREELPIRVLVYIPEKDYIKTRYAGMVVGEFVCDKYVSAVRNADGVFECIDDQTAIERSCKTLEQLDDYADGYRTLFGWNVTKLKVYENPKNMRRFSPTSWRWVRSGDFSKEDCEELNL